MKQKGFTLIELLAAIIILGILVATAAPRYFNLTTDARLAQFDDLLGQTKAMINNIDAMKEISGRVYQDNNNQDFLEYSSGVDLMLENGFLHLGDVCKALGMTDTSVAQNHGVETESYNCKWEGSDHVRILVNGMTKNQCFLKYTNNSYTSRPTTILTCGAGAGSPECLCP